MVSFTKAAIVNSPLPHFMSAMFNSSPVNTLMLSGLLYESKSTPRILHTFEYNFTAISTRAFIIIHVGISFFSSTFHAVNVAIIVLLFYIKLEPFSPEPCAIWHFFKKKEKLISVVFKWLEMYVDLLLSSLSFWRGVGVRPFRYFAADSSKYPLSFWRFVSEACESL